MNLPLLFATLDPAQQERLIDLQRHAAVSVYATLIYSGGFLMLIAATTAVAARWNRTALFFLGLYGFSTFWIPSAPTLYCSPIIFVVSLVGWVLLTIRKVGTDHDRK